MTSRFALLYDIHSLQPDQKVEGHLVRREAYALFESGEDDVEVIKVMFNDWNEVNLCALLGII